MIAFNYFRLRQCFYMIKTVCIHFINIGDIIHIKSDFEQNAITQKNVHLYIID